MCSTKHSVCVAESKGFKTRKHKLFQMKKLSFECLYDKQVNVFNRLRVTTLTPLDISCLFLSQLVPCFHDKSMLLYFLSVFVTCFLCGSANSLPGVYLCCWRGVKLG